MSDPSAAFHPILPGDLPPLRPTLVRGQGVHVWDVDGRRYLDAISGTFCVQLGYGREDLPRAASEAMSRLPFARPSVFESEPSEAYARELLERVGGPYTRVILTSSGSEAVEAALKAAYFAQGGEPRRAHAAHLRRHFHGATVEALRVTDVRARRAPYEAWLGPDTALDATDERALRDALLDATALIAETVPAVGCGAEVPPPGFLAKLRRACDAANAYWIADEVLTGFHRVGPLFAWQRLAQRPEDDGARPDIIVFGKGAGCGYAPLGGVLLSERVAKALEGSAHAPFLHAQTYGGHAVACAVGRQVLTAMREEGIEARVREMEPGLEEALQPLGRHRAVGEVRGMGFLRGVILHDRDAEEPFPRELRMAERVEARCRDRGLLVYGGWGSVDGERGDHLLVAPPLTAEPHHFNQIATILRQVLDEVLREARSELES